MLFLALTFVTPSWRYGPFTWFPLARVQEIAGAPVEIGAFNLLPLVLVAGVLVIRLVDGTREGWQWGRREITLPFLGLTVLGLASLDLLSPRRTSIHAVGLAIAWLVYLFVLNERPSLTVPLTFVLVIQGAVAALQFFRQQDVGLASLGELPLHPAWHGITVLFARGTRWLRAYGLTAHPNLLGAILAIILLFVWPVYGRQRGWGRVGLGLALAAGNLGLALSFSRSAWLGFGLGFAVLFFEIVANDGAEKGRISAIAQALLPLLPALLLLLVYFDLTLSRFIALDTPIEARSLGERASDTQIALQLIADHPWRGVGLGNYDGRAQAIDAYANRVHNVPLFVTAELGVPGGLLWLWLALTPLLARSPDHRLNPSKLAPWLAMLLMSQFDTMVWVSSNWQTAVLFALLAAWVSRDEEPAVPLAVEQPG